MTKQSCQNSVFGKTRRLFSLVCDVQVHKANLVGGTCQVVCVVIDLGTQVGWRRWETKRKWKEKKSKWQENFLISLRFLSFLSIYCTHCPLSSCTIPWWSLIRTNSGNQSTARVHYQTWNKSQKWKLLLVLARVDFDFSTPLKDARSL